MEKKMNPPIVFCVIKADSRFAVRIVGLENLLNRESENYESQAIS